MKSLNDFTKKFLAESLTTGAVAFGADNALTDDVDRMASFAVYTGSEYLDPKGNAKKRKTTKADTSFLNDEEDAEKDHIKGEMDTSGKPKGSK
jgi:hypothetical protein